tara:strand:+ start:807 stop:1373 length:567 start_codon:yes stop_codon:yes gene_type:complete
MSKSQVNIFKFKVLYNILFEVKDFLKFEVNYIDNELDIHKINIDNSIILTNKKINDNSEINKYILLIDSFPVNFVDLIDRIHARLLKQKYSYQSNFNIKNYKLDMNSRVISLKNKRLKLTEKEIEIILFLNFQKKPQKIDVLQKEVWGYSENLETHTVETHVYRLRKKINEVFNDENFLISEKDGYKI